MIFLHQSKVWMPLSKWLSGAAVLAIALGFSSLVQASSPTVQHYGNVDYITGGFGQEDSTAIKDAMSDYPLVLTFSSSDGGRGAYVSKVQVVVRDNNNATVLNVESQGPFLLARLPEGAYQIFATYRNQTHSRSVTLSDAKSTRVAFDWSRDTPATSND